MVCPRYIETPGLRADIWGPWSQPYIHTMATAMVYGLGWGLGLRVQGSGIGVKGSGNMQEMAASAFQARPTCSAAKDAHSCILDLQPLRVPKLRFRVWRFWA